MLPSSSACTRHRRAASLSGWLARGRALDGQGPEAAGTRGGRDGPTELVGLPRVGLVHGSGGSLRNANRAAVDLDRRGPDRGREPEARIQSGMRGVQRHQGTPALAASLVSACMSRRMSPRPWCVALTVTSATSVHGMSAGPPARASPSIVASVATGTSWLQRGVAAGGGRRRSRAGCVPRPARPLRWRRARRARGAGCRNPLNRAVIQDRVCGSGPSSVHWAGNARYCMQPPPAHGTRARRRPDLDASTPGPRRLQCRGHDLDGPDAGHRVRRRSGSAPGSAPTKLSIISASMSDPKGHHWAPLCCVARHPEVEGVDPDPPLGADDVEGQPTPGRRRPGLAPRAVDRWR